jgi:cell filamentation protein
LAADAFADPYAYKGTTVLKNRLGTRDQATLESFELEMSTLRAAEPLPRGRFGPTHYCAIHHHIFQDVYPWAGRYRTVRTAKDGNWFCYPEHISAEMTRIFRDLREQDFLRKKTFEEFVDGATHFLAELNAIHPFREGNGRVQLIFLHQLAIKAWHPLDLDRVRPRKFLEAMVRSFNRENGLLRHELMLLRSR